MTLDFSFFVLFATFLTSSLYLYLKNHFSFWSKKNIPGPKPSLLTGNYDQLRKESHLIVHKKFIEKYGRVFGMFDLNRPKLIVADPDLIKQMLVKDFTSLTNRRSDGFDHPIEKKMSFIQEGEDWKRSRGVMTPAYSSSKFKSIFEQIEICSEKLLEYFNDLVTTEKANNADTMELFKNYSGDVISRSTFSLSFVKSYSSYDRVTDSVLNYFYPSQFKLFLSYILPRWFKTMIKFSVFKMDVLNYAVSVFRWLIEERKTKSEINEKQNDMLKLLMNSTKRLNWDDDHVIANLVLLYLAGAHSTNYTLSNLVYIFAKYPQIHENVIKELEQVESRHEKLALDVISNEFKYLDSVISEIHRLYPSTTYTERQVSAKEYTFEYNGKKYTLPNGTLIYVPIFVLHRDKEFFQEPEKFDETRFSPENSASINPYAYMPYGQGPRNCIGVKLGLVSIKVAALKIVKQFKYKLVDENFELNNVNETIDELLVTDKIYVKVEKRVQK